MLDEDFTKYIMDNQFQREFFKIVIMINLIRLLSYSLYIYEL